VQAESGKTCGEKGYNPVAESYNHELLGASVRAQSVLLCEPTSIRARVYISSLNLVLLGFALAQDIESGNKAELLAEPVRRRRIRLQRVGHHFKFPLKLSLSLYIRIAVSCSPPMGKVAGRAVISYNLDMSRLILRASLY